MPKIMKNPLISLVSIALARRLPGIPFRRILPVYLSFGFFRFSFATCLESLSPCFPHTCTAYRSYRYGSVMDAGANQRVSMLAASTDIMDEHIGAVNRHHVGVDVADIQVVHNLIRYPATVENRRHPHRLIIGRPSDPGAYLDERYR